MSAPDTLMPLVSAPCMPLVLRGLAPDAVARGLKGTMPSMWATATALSLTLITPVTAKHK